MDKFKIGDKVKIIENLGYNDKLDGLSTSETMLKYSGKIATVIESRRLLPNVPNAYYYIIDLDDGVHYWGGFMIEPYTNTYTIHNLLNNFPSETKFLSNDHLFRIQLGELQTYDEDTQEWRKSINSLKQILDMKFIKVEGTKKHKFILFEQAIKSNKNIRFNSLDGEQDEFKPINETILNLAINYPTYMADIILKGQWFAEGVYEEE